MQIVPGLIGVILTMTMVLFTAVAIVRERERGNLELLITTPVRTPELMIGKIIPYVLIGLVQVTLVLRIGVCPVRRAGARHAGSTSMRPALIFIAASLSLGLLISTLAQNQFQAMQMTFFVFLPSILLSGFMFPFDGMPRFAQRIAEVLPLTHFVRIIRGIMLRGATLAERARRARAAGAVLRGDHDARDPALPQAPRLSALRGAESQAPSPGSRGGKHGFEPPRAARTDLCLSLA